MWIGKMYLIRWSFFRFRLHLLLYTVLVLHFLINQCFSLNPEGTISELFTFLFSKLHSFASLVYDILCIWGKAWLCWNFDTGWRSTHMEQWRIGIQETPIRVIGAASGVIMAKWFCCKLPNSILLFVAYSWDFLNWLWCIEAKRELFTWGIITTI